MEWNSVLPFEQCILPGQGKYIVQSWFTELADLNKLSLGVKAIAYEVGPANWSRIWVGEKTDIWGCDVRSCDVSGEDLSGIADWNDISFNSDTRWPSADKLPKGEKIRVISISFGASPKHLGYQELEDAIQAAGEEEILVLTVSPEYFYPGFEFLGMSRDGLADPNDPQSYRPAAWLISLRPNWPNNTITVPMGGRTCAGCTGEAVYEWSCEGGMSWAVPWLAGFYALCCQVAPDCTADQFFQAVQDTAATKLLYEYDGLPYRFGRIIDPAAVIEVLENQ